MRVLAIETATPLASAAVVDEDGVLAESVLRAPMFHLEWLLPAIEAMLAQLAMTPGAIQGVAVSAGPGGFTGLRIGIATAAAWATMRRVPRGVVHRDRMIDPGPPHSESPKAHRAHLYPPRTAPRTWCPLTRRAPASGTQPSFHPEPTNSYWRRAPRGVSTTRSGV